MRFYALWFCLGLALHGRVGLAVAPHIDSKPAKNSRQRPPAPPEDVPPQDNGLKIPLPPGNVEIRCRDGRELITVSTTTTNASYVSKIKHIWPDSREEQIAFPLIRKLSPNGEWALTDTDHPSTMAIYNTKTGQKQSTLVMKEPVFSHAVFSDNGAYLAIPDRETQLVNKIVSTKDGTVVRSVPKNFFPGWVSNDGKWIVQVKTLGEKLVNLETGKIFKLKQDSEWVSDVASSPDGTLLAIRLTDAKTEKSHLQVREFPSMKLLYERPLKGPAALQFSHRGGLLWTDGDIISVLEAQTGKELETPPNPPYLRSRKSIVCGNPPMLFTRHIALESKEHLIAREVTGLLDNPRPADNPKSLARHILSRDAVMAWKAIATLSNNPRLREQVKAELNARKQPKLSTDDTQRFKEIFAKRLLSSPSFQRREKVREEIEGLIQKATPDELEKTLLPILNNEAKTKDIDLEKHKDELLKLIETLRPEDPKALQNRLLNLEEDLNPKPR